MDIATTLGASGERIDDIECFVSVFSEVECHWSVRKFRLTEEVSDAYKLSMDISTELGVDQEVEDFPLEDLLGVDVSLEIHRSGASRSVCGLIQRCSLVGASSGGVTVAVQVVPGWVYAVQRVDTRIFQHFTVPEILDGVITEALEPYGRRLDASRLNEDYVTRDYCVQYAESDLEFASRLMEEEGITYIFRPEVSDGKPTGVEIMILLDQEEGKPNADFLDVDGAFDEEVRVISDHPELASVESMQALQWILPEGPNKVSVRSYNWKRPVPNAIPEAERSNEARKGRLREIYIPEDRRRTVDERGNEAYVGTEVEEDEVPRTRRRFELTVGDRAHGLASSNLIGVTAGCIVPLGDHPNPAVGNQRLLVTQVTHVGDLLGGKVRYHNSFACIHVNDPLRPLLKTRRPRIHGPQTAIVTGPEGEEIHTDEHGRIKVRFHWDRLSPLDDTSSCWVRVAQAWAGPNWGTWFLPRVGMEVLVEFLDGNPDRPLVTGCVYNGSNHPPYTLPDDKTKSTIKTNSSPGGGGSNEIRFEDAKGSEEIYTHAQKNYAEVVENNHNTTVHNNQSNTVDASQTNSIGGDQTESVGGKQTMSVDKNRKVTIAGSQSVTISGAEAEDGVSGFKLDITGDYKVDASNTVEVQAPTHIKLSCGGSSLLLEPNKITLTAGGQASVELDVNALVRSAAGSKLKLDADALTQSSGGSKVKLDASALAQSSGGSKVLLDANALTQSSGGSKVLLDASALMSSPSSATINAPTATLAGAGGSVEAAGAGVTCAGSTVGVSGGMVNISGGLVKIN